LPCAARISNWLPRKVTPSWAEYPVSGSHSSTPTAPGKVALWLSASIAAVTANVACASRMCQLL
jgi:hypothetical protein